MKCPCCGAAELVKDTRDVPYVHEDKTTAIPAVSGEFCPACGEVVLNREHGNRYGALIAEVQKRQAERNSDAPD